MATDNLITMFNLDYLEEIHGSDPDAAIIWLHGLGASGHDFLPVVSQLNLPDEPAIDFIFPHAPVQPVSINQGMAMPAWYDILQLDLHAQEDRAGILKRRRGSFDRLSYRQAGSRKFSLPL